MKLERTRKNFGKTMLCVSISNYLKNDDQIILFEAESSV